jgi:Flp pilus assembly protein TadG
MDRATTRGRNGHGRSSQRGSYALLSSLLIVALVGLSAFSVDVALITMAELQAQATADAASHAALVGYRKGGASEAEGRLAAEGIVSQNRVGLEAATLDGVEFGTWDYSVGAFLTSNVNVNAARAKVSRTRANGNALELMLAPLLGVHSVDLDAEGVTAEQLRAIMLVMDMSQSMMAGDVSVANSPVNVGRKANIGFVDYLMSNPVQDDLVGLAMFGAAANRAPTAGKPRGSPVLPMDARPDPKKDPPWLPLSFIDTQTALIRQRLNGICDTLDTDLCVPGVQHPLTADVGGVGTNPGPAMYQAVNELTDTARVGATYFKAMVVFSDGYPTKKGMGAQGGIDAANAAWANDIYIWTILWAKDAGDAAYMNMLVRGAPMAFSQSSQDVAQLPAMYQVVAESLPTALVY